MTVCSEAYHAASATAVFADRSANMRLSVAGPDRAKFLHNLTTNEVKRLPEGKACEAFITNLQGKTLALVSLIIEPDRILVRTDPAARDGLPPHLHKYGIFDDVQISDVTASTFEFHVAGPRAGDWLRALGVVSVPAADLDHGHAQLEGTDVRVLRESPTGRPGFTVIGPVEAKEKILSALDATAGNWGAQAADDAAYEVMRIEAGTPRFGQDLTADNLPQELNRDARAICFVKGCYLGQETVARLDALGHVNKILKGWHIEGEHVPAPGTPLESDGKVVGKVTSAAFSPGCNATVGLALIRTSHAEPGEVLRLELDGQSFAATVAELPMLRVSS